MAVRKDEHSLAPVAELVDATGIKPVNLEEVVRVRIPSGAQI